MIKRIENIEKELVMGKVLIIFGARQVGKTTLIKNFLSDTKLRYKFVTGDDLQLGISLSACTIESTKDFVEDFELLVIDEAQKIQNIGLALKLMVDNYPGKYFIATSSSSFDLASKTSESLTGRKRIIELFPISQKEMVGAYSLSKVKTELETTLIYGSFPEVLTMDLVKEKEKIIRLITNSYLLKDILEFEGLKNAKVVYNILKLLAFQIGSEVSIKELASNVNADSKTVTKYLDLLEKSFVIFSLGGFSRNLRKEVNKMSKYYFTDNGIRNALISNFNKIEDRDDIGRLWENFLMVERRKRNSYVDFSTNSYFWRTYEKQEIDLIEESGGKLNGYEFKWRNKNSKSPKIWLKAYENSSYLEINRENYLDFLLH